MARGGSPTGIALADAIAQIKAAAQTRGYTLSDEDAQNHLRNTGWNGSDSVDQGSLGYIVNTAIPGWEDRSGAAPEGETPPAATTNTPPAAATNTGPRYQGGGVDLKKWNDPTHASAKYQVLRILDQVPPAQARAQLKAGAGAIVDQLKALGFTISSDNKISRSDVGTVDVIHGGDKEYGWRPDSVEKPPAKPPFTVSPPGVPTPPPANGAFAVDSHPTTTGQPPTLGGGSTTFPGEAPGKSGIDPRYLEPWTEAFKGPASLPTWSYENFQAPGMDSVYADPGFQFRTKEGTRALEGSAAAQGMLRTGGTLKDIVNYGQAAASQEYGQVFNRAQTAYNTNRSTSQGAYDTLAAKNSADYSRALADYQQRYAIFRNNQNDPWAKLQDLARLGQNSAIQQ